MDQELKGFTTASQIKAPRSRYVSLVPHTLLAIDIIEIGAVSFHYNLYKPEGEVFVTSL
jgi:hypothetical protein